MTKNIGVILCGCGSMDGSEIHEATFTLSAIDELGANYQCFAFNEEQGRLINFLTGKEENEKRNQLKESARIARGQIKILDLNELNKLDAIIFPGGFGLAFNLCNFAQTGSKAEVKPEIAQLIKNFHASQKPIGAICIAPALIALVLGQTAKPIITAGDEDNEVVSVFRELNCTVLPCETTDCIIDEKNKIITTPAYMNAKRISDVRKGIYKLVENILEMI